MEGGSARSPETASEVVVEGENGKAKERAQGHERDAQRGMADAVYQKRPMIERRAGAATHNVDSKLFAPALSFSLQGDGAASFGGLDDGSSSG